MTYSIDTVEGMDRAKAWTANMLRMLKPQAAWAVPRSGSIYFIDQDAKTVTRESGEDEIDRVFVAMGYTILTGQGQRSP